MKKLLVLLVVVACGDIEPAQPDAGIVEASSPCLQQCRVVADEGIRAVKACVEECRAPDDDAP